LIEAIIESSRLPKILKEIVRSLALWFSLPLRFTDKVAKDKEILGSYSHTICALGQKIKEGK